MKTPPNTPKVFLLHVPGADLQFIHPLVDAGHLPNLRSLIDRGSIGNLQAVPLLRHPTSTVTLATGTRADKHGVFGLLQTSDDGAVCTTTRADLNAHPMWELATQSGIKSAAVGWPASYPASHFKGSLIVADAFAEAIGPTYDDWPFDPLSVSDPALHDTMTELRLHPSEVSADMILPFVQNAASIDVETDERIELLLVMMARTMTLHGAATWIAEHNDCDLLAVNFDFIERLTTRFLKFRAPRMGNVTTVDFNRYKDVVDGCYRMLDLLIGTYLHLLPDDIHIVLTSGHGFISEADRRAAYTVNIAQHAQMYSERGLIVAAGPAFKFDHLNTGCGTPDVVPTVLALLGIGSPTGLDGHVFQDIFGNDINDPPVMPSPASQPTIPKASEAHHARRIHEWASLGYLPKLSGDNDSNAEKISVANLVSKAEMLMLRRVYDEAYSALETALSLMPDQLDARMRIAQCALALGRHQECADALSDLADMGYTSPMMQYLQGHLALVQGDVEKSDTLFDPLVLRENPTAKDRQMIEAIGTARMQHNQKQTARASFQRALEIDPTSVAALSGLGDAWLAEKQCDMAIDAYQTALKTNASHPILWAKLGRALAANTEVIKAKAAFETALKLNPDLVLAKDGLRHLTRVISTTTLNQSIPDQDQ